jgi:hypothetical protein
MSSTTTAAGTQPYKGRLDSTADAVYRKVGWRLIPLLFLCYIVAYLDRVNVGFAKLQMQERPAVQRGGLRAGRGHLLHRLLSLRGAQQRGAAPAWARAAGSPAS